MAMAAGPALWGSGFGVVFTKFVVEVLAAWQAATVAATPDQVVSLPGLDHDEPLGVQFAGYASGSEAGERAEDAEIFYWFVGAKGADYRTRPTILWSNGGPGASSFWGFFLENGPYEIAGTAEEPRLLPRRHAWSDLANFLIFEHPLGVTLSVEGATGLPRNVTAGVRQLYRALLNFSAQHPDVAATPWVLAGESYAGTYLPLLAREILLASDAYGGQLLPNLHAMVLGDPWIDPAVQQSTSTEYAFTHGLISLDQKRELDEKFALNKTDLSVAITNISGIYMLNPASPGDPSTQPVLDYLNRRDVREAIHAKQGVPVKGLSTDEIHRLYHNGENDSYLAVLQMLLDKGLRTLVVSGLNDATDCNFLGTGAWLRLLTGSAAAAFQAASPERWRSGGQVLGYVLDGGRLAWIKVLNAGHLAALDQPLLIDLILERTTGGGLSAGGALPAAPAPGVAAGDGVGVAAAAAPADLDLSGDSLLV